jgi:hypothetical protein
MMTRLIGAVLACALGFLCADSTLAIAQSVTARTDGNRGVWKPPAGIESTRATTVKSSKSNTSDRMGGGGGGKGTASGGTGKPKALNEPPRGGQGIDFPGRR